ncbi:DUF3990 domain-containing protein [Butyrivibrio sp. LC3010]|uniref:DUF3990 domain-containing protein n=1 Tax=Butyrivibrio sp. LC3010 TaxID=1280680 RepID=UPI00040FC368|nr:DUF3990 domain-containing protein [Butyrivibrio sp. LC3010]
MKLKDGMLLYHGSYTSVENIDLNQCMNGKDFGKGFYLTSDPKFPYRICGWLFGVS